MKEVIFETYKEMIDFLENGKDIDDIIIEASKKVIEDPNLELQILKIRCVEINKKADVKFKYDDIYDSLHKVLKRKIYLEDYESCHDIKIMLDSVSRNKELYEKQTNE